MQKLSSNVESYYKVLTKSIQYFKNSQIIIFFDNRQKKPFLDRSLYFNLILIVFMSLSKNIILFMFLML